MLEDVINFDYIPDVFSYTRLDFLYAGDGLVASTDPVWLQGEFVTLTGRWVFIQTLGRRLG